VQVGRSWPTLYACRNEAALKNFLHPVAVLQILDLTSIRNQSWVSDLGGTTDLCYYERVDEPLSVLYSFHDGVSQSQSRVAGLVITGWRLVIQVMLFDLGVVKNLTSSAHFYSTSRDDFLHNRLALSNAMDKANLQLTTYSVGWWLRVITNVDWWAHGHAHCSSKFLPALSSLPLCVPTRLAQMPSFRLCFNRG